MPNPPKRRRAAACPAIFAAAAIITARLRRCSPPRRRRAKGGRYGTSTERVFRCRQKNYRASTPTSESPARRSIPATSSFPACSMRAFCAARIPHAKIVSIDTSKAEKLPGVKAVIHHGNAKIPWSSGGHTHQRFIFNNPVRFVGDRGGGGGGDGSPYRRRGA